MLLLNRPGKVCGGATGRNCARVVMARLRTAGRGWESNGVSTERGGGCRLGSDRYEGKRVIKIDKIASVSIRVSGGMFAYDHSQCESTYTCVDEVRTHIGELCK